MRRTKIVATLGPTSDSESGIRKLLRAGANVFRLNFSHGTRDGHSELAARVRAVAQTESREVALLQDLCGPKIRVGEMDGGKIELVPDAEIVITTDDLVGTPNRISTSYDNLARDVQPGDRILLDDGKLELVVISEDGPDVRCRIVRGGFLKNRKGMNLPGTKLSTPSVTEKDLADLETGIAIGVDFVALSFVRRASDIETVREALAVKAPDTQIIAKIEKPEAIENIDAILDAADGIMVARGDLGIEMEISGLPVLQKDLIRRAHQSDKLVITATQMLESMIQSSIPTRAEAADVANAIVDGTDAVMLSGETAAGEYPAEAVAMMDKIARKTEQYLIEHPPAWDWGRLNPAEPVMDALAHAAFALVEDLDGAAIGCYSASGNTARFLSKSRPFAPILAFSANPRAVRRMQLMWGVVPVLTDAIINAKTLRATARDTARDAAWRGHRNRLVLVAGAQFGQIGSANGLEVAKIDE